MIDTDGLHKIRLNYSEDSADGSKLNEDELIDFSEDQDNQVKNSAILFGKCKLLVCILNGQLKSCVYIVNVSKTSYLYKCQIQSTGYIDSLQISWQERIVHSFIKPYSRKLLY